MTSEQLAEIERMYAATTHGNWTATDGCAVLVDGYRLIADTFASGSDHPGGASIGMPWPREQCLANARFIAGTHTAIPSLIAIAKAALAYEAAKKSAAKARAYWFWEKGPCPLVTQPEEDQMAARVDAADRNEVACREAYYSALAQVTP